jgi:hypothetical protein
MVSLFLVTRSERRKEQEMYRDAPNAWPPHQYIALQALRALPSNVTSGALPVPSSGQSTFSLIPSGQLGLTEDQLPGQPIRVEGSQNRNASTSGPGADVNKLNGTVVNGGNATQGEGWAKALERQLASRYLTSAFCSWYAPMSGYFPKVAIYLSIGMRPEVRFQELYRGYPTLS